MNYSVLTATTPHYVWKRFHFGFTHTSVHTSVVEPKLVTTPFYLTAHSICVLDFEITKPAHIFIPHGIVSEVVFDHASRISEILKKDTDRFGWKLIPYYSKTDNIFKLPMLAYVKYDTMLDDGTIGFYTMYCQLILNTEVPIHKIPYYWTPPV